MKKLFIAILFLSLPIKKVFAQTDSIPIAKYVTAMIPMRDGVKLKTIIRIPLDNGDTLMPIILIRTPYGATAPKDSIQYMFKGYQKAFGINVSQNIRGRNGSEGVKDLHPSITHIYKPGATDESTDTWDTIDWLIKNLKSHNGRVAMTGCSYPGWLALVGAIDPHPALKAVIEEACMADLWLGDDFHHNGAFRLQYSFGYTWGMEKGTGLNYTEYDLYDFFLKLGPIKNVDEKYFNKTVPAWNEFVEHPDYNDFWKRNSPLNYMQYPQVSILHRGGYYDQEDINGPQLMYSHLEKKDSFNRNFL
jgi:putative CocE/NonD family hydrolase